MRPRVARTRHTRGSSTPAGMAVLAVMALTATIWSGHGHRTDELPFADRARCRAAARWAAESAIARGRAQIDAGAPPAERGGQLPGRVRYRLEVRAEKESLQLTGIGYCRHSRGLVSTQVVATFERDGPKWVASDWRELPGEPPVHR